MLKLYVAVDVSDDDVTLAEVAEQCGYDVRHPLVLDVAEPVVAHFHEQDCLQLALTCPDGVVDAVVLLAEAELLLSHPSVSAVYKIGISE
ncbi:hypothetical protein EOE67_01740 [Rheinheimera riviphila]|uniref:Uncharacterized protein n=1 Tax=Rheinheimera riviphila TaxID=1834037 RepID=A0A437R577_9GAMM|nr:hypothetical protein [Rheinheimera riviphila]RVU41939.1 hypothetical protein EOE67_01740 [Rheinheimera riviphila]